MKKNVFLLLLILMTGISLTGCATNVKSGKTYKSRHKDINGEYVDYIYFSRSGESHSDYGKPQVKLGTTGNVLFMILPSDHITELYIEGLSGKIYSNKILKVEDTFIVYSYSKTSGELNIGEYAIRLNEDFILKSKSSTSYAKSFKIKVIS